MILRAPWHLLTRSGRLEIKRFQPPRTTTARPARPHPTGSLIAHAAARRLQGTWWQSGGRAGRGERAAERDQIAGRGAGAGAGRRGVGRGRGQSWSGAVWALEDSLARGGEVAVAAAAVVPAAAGPAAVA